MSRLGLIALLTGVVLAGLGGGLMAASASFRKAVAGFPRDRRAAVILTIIDMVWAGWLLHETPLGFLDKWKPLLYVLVPVSIVILVFFMDDLLSARALGGLLILLPAPILDAARWHPSSWRFVVTVLAYLAAVAGMVLAMGPYYFRKVAAWSLDPPGRRHVCGGALAGVGLLLVALSLAVF